MNIGVQIALWESEEDFDCIPRRGISGSYGSSTFKYLRNLHTVFHNGCANLHSHQQCTRVSFSPLLRQPFVFFFNNSHPDRSEEVSHCALICISPVVSDIEHLFIRLLAICVFSLEKCLVRSFPLCFLFLPFVSPLFQKTTVFCCYSLGFCFTLLSCMSSF